MRRCSTCNSLILFNGIKEDDLIFCNTKCRVQGQHLVLARSVPEDLVTRQAQEIHAGPCPSCQGSGPVDVHRAHFIWSALLLSSWGTKVKVCCRSCGIKHQMGTALGSFFVGWWGFPWGIIFTPVQIVRNVMAISSPPNEMMPSDELRKLVSIHIAAQAIAQQQQRPQSPPSLPL